MAFQRRKPEAIGAKALFPGFVAPALATPIDKVPRGTRWIHEIKFDGCRVQVHLANEEVKIFTRRGHDWTKRFKKVADDAWYISAASVIIDGEVVAPAADGTTDSQCCRTSSEENPARSSWLRSICSISAAAMCGNYP